MWPRLPLVLSVVALCVAVAGTPVGQAGTDAVRRALFAQNAGAGSCWR